MYLTKVMSTPQKLYSSKVQLPQNCPYVTYSSKCTPLLSGSGNHDNTRETNKGTHGTNDIYM